jgi:hypothetical protein
MFVIHNVLEAVTVSIIRVLITYSEWWMKLQNHIYKLSTTFCNYTLIITNYYSRSKHHNCHIISSRVMSWVNSQQDGALYTFSSLTDMLWSPVWWNSQKDKQLKATPIYCNHSTRKQCTTESKTVWFTECNAMACYKTHSVHLVWTHLYFSVIYFTSLYHYVWAGVPSDDSFERNTY